MRTLAAVPVGAVTPSRSIPPFKPKRAQLCGVQPCGVRPPARNLASLTRVARNPAALDLASLTLAALNLAARNPPFKPKRRYRKVHGSISALRLEPAIGTLRSAASARVP